MRFEQRLRDGIHSGAIVLAFRRWKRSQVVPGHAIAAEKLISDRGSPTLDQLALRP